MHSQDVPAEEAYNPLRLGRRGTMTKIQFIKLEGACYGKSREAGR